MRKTKLKHKKELLFVDAFKWRESKIFSATKQKISDKEDKLPFGGAEAPVENGESELHEFLTARRGRTGNGHGDCESQRRRI